MSSKKMVVAVFAMLMVAGAAQAEGTMGGIGFRSLDGPFSVLENTGIGFTTSPAIGLRHWLNEKTGLDLAIGFASISTESSPPSANLDEGSGFVLDLGVPFVVKKLDKVNFIFRPGLMYGTATATDKTTATAGNEAKTTLMSFSAELEVEYMLTDNLSISAAHGVGYFSQKTTFNTNPEAENKVSGFGTAGSNFAQLGFHVYLW